MKILEFEQRSEEWFAYRDGRIGGGKAKDYAKPRYISKDELVKYAQEKGYEFKPTITMNNIRELMSQQEIDELDYSVQMSDAIYKLIAENIAKPINANDYEDRTNGRKFSMALRGEILEDEARARISTELGIEVMPGRVWESDFNDKVYVSPDGEIIEETTIDDVASIIVRRAVEIKCLDSWKIVKAFYEQAPPDEYRQQIVQYFLVNENLEELYFCLYSDAFAAAPALELQIFPITRKEVEREVEAARILEENVLKIVDTEVQRFIF